MTNNLSIYYHIRDLIQLNNVTTIEHVTLDLNGNVLGGKIITGTTRELYDTIKIDNIKNIINFRGYNTKTGHKKLTITYLNKKDPK